MINEETTFSFSIWWWLLCRSFRAAISIIFFTDQSVVHTAGFPRCHSLPRPLRSSCQHAALSEHLSFVLCSSDLHRVVGHHCLLLRPILPSCLPVLSSTYNYYAVDASALTTASMKMTTTNLNSHQPAPHHKCFTPKSTTTPDVAQNFKRALQAVVSFSRFEPVLNLTFSKKLELGRENSQADHHEFSGSLYIRWN